MGKLNRQQKRNKPKKAKKIIDIRVWFLVILCVGVIGANVFDILTDSYVTREELGYIELLDMIEAGKVEFVSVVKNEPAASVTDIDGNVYSILNPQSDTFIEDLMKMGVAVEYRKGTLFDAIIQLILTLPMASIMIVLLAYLLLVVLGSHTQTFSIIKQKDNDTSFNDIRGITETKEEVKRLINTIKEWKKLGELGARPVKGILFYGPPGTGKTMLAKAIAKEADLSFISASGSDFIEQFVGMGARRVRDLWTLAETNAPCVLFIDEIDCLGKRSTDGDIVSREHNQTMNALLQRMDGLSTKSGVIVVAATNSIESLDEALLRSGRFDRKFYVGPPSTKADRDSVVELYCADKKFADGVTVEKVSKLLYGFTAADIDEIMSDAVYISIADGREGIVRLSDIDDASMKQRFNGVKKEHSSQKDIDITATHEAAHTLVHLLQGDKVSKVSIIAYSSGVGGVTVPDVDELGDRKLLMQSELNNKIRALLAGKCGEDIIYGEHTQGCSNDIEKASQIIYEMVTSYAYDSSLMFNMNKNSNEHIDKDVIKKCNDILSKREAETMEMVRNNLESLNKLKKQLLEEKTLVNPSI